MLKICKRVWYELLKLQLQPNTVLQEPSFSGAVIGHLPGLDIYGPLLQKQSMAQGIELMLTA